MRRSLDETGADQLCSVEVVRIVQGMTECSLVQALSVWWGRAGLARMPSEVDHKFGYGNG